MQPEPGSVDLSRSTGERLWEEQQAHRWTGISARRAIAAGREGGPAAAQCPGTLSPKPLFTAEKESGLDSWSGSRDRRSASGGTGVTQSVKPPTLGFGSGLGLEVS